jgi:hypothetical protein
MSNDNVSGQDQISKDAAELAVLFPGRTIDLLKPDGTVWRTVRVVPMGVVHMRRFISALEEVIPKIAVQVDFQKVAGGDKGLSNLIPMIVPILTSDLIDLLDVCVEGLNLRTPGIPHFWLPQLAEAWIDESFGSEDRARPWVDTVDRVLSKVTGNEPLGLWATLSRSSVEKATLSTPSSEPNSPDSPIEATP